MTGKLDFVFEYEPVPACVCGRGLGNGDRAVTKSTPAGPVHFVRCACGSWIQSPAITAASLTRWYDSPEYQSRGAGPYLHYSRAEAARRAEAVARYERDLADRLPSGSRVLEVGCATGSFLWALRAAGHEAVGLDISDAFASQARAEGLDVRTSDFRGFEAAEGSFDAIVLLGTIANLQDLPEHLAKARRLLRPDGLLYFNAPVTDAWVVRLYGTRLWMFTPSMSQFCSTAGLRAALIRAGFEMDRFRNDRQRPTVSKLLGQSGLRVLYPLARSLGVAEWSPPFSVRAPGVIVAWGRPRPSVGSP